MPERLGLKDALASKITVPKTEISTELVAKGEIELAIIVATQAFTTPGVELAGTTSARDSVLWLFRWCGQFSIEGA